MRCMKYIADANVAVANGHTQKNANSCGSYFCRDETIVIIQQNFLFASRRDVTLGRRLAPITYFPHSVGMRPQ